MSPGLVGTGSGRSKNGVKRLKAKVRVRQFVQDNGSGINVRGPLGWAETDHVGNVEQADRLAKGEFTTGKLAELSVRP